MMTAEDTTLLQDQLSEALAERPPADPIEVATLAGLLARVHPEDALVARARAATLRLKPGELAAAAGVAMDAFGRVGRDDEPAESWDALIALDELSAAAVLLSRAAEVAPILAEAARLVRAFPEPWCVHADIASTLLAGRDDAGADPSWLLWAAVEASPWAAQAIASAAADPEAEGASPATRIALGLDVVVPLFGAASTAPRLAAADPIAAEAPWVRLAGDTGWELALTVDEARQPLLLVAGDPDRIDVSFSRDGQDCAACRDPEGWTCPAAAGQWRVCINGADHSFEIAG